MKQDLFQFLPSEIIINILTRLDNRTIGKSKCVCKPWRDLISTDSFVKSHLSKSVPVLAVLLGMEIEAIECKFLEFIDKDGDESDYDYDVDLHYDLLTRFYVGRDDNIAGAADGLLLLQSHSKPFTLSICNPLTREYAELCGAVQDARSSICGFGTSKITWQHKAVQIIPKRFSGCKCHVNVYTLETGSWRCFEANAKLEYNGTYGAFVNGNLHWKGPDLIACFDLETESFTTLSLPPLEVTARPYEMSVCALKDCLCVCTVMPLPSEEDVFVIEIWLMKEYGVEKCWTKEYVIRQSSTYDCEMDKYHYVRPMKVFKDGDILFSMVDFAFRIFHYSNEYRDACKIDELDLPMGHFPSVLVTPSFLSLKSFGMENAFILEYVSEDDKLSEDDKDDKLSEDDELPEDDKLSEHDELSEDDEMGI